MMTGHKNVRRYSDQYHCSECGKQWDINDPDPPQCKRDSSAGENAIREMRKMFCKKPLHGK